MSDRGVRPWLLALVLAVLIAAPAQAEESLPSDAWMAHCAQNLAPEQLPEKIVRKYCACMAGIGDEAEMLTWSQVELERSYPPAHVKCHEEARE